MNELEDFLKRLAQQAQTAQRAAREAAFNADDDEIIDAEIVEDASPGPVRRDWRTETEAAKAPLPLAGTDFSPERVSFGWEIHQADDRMEDHLHDVFEHQLGELGAVTGAAAESTLDDDGMPRVTPVASQIVAMLRTPGTLRNTIVLGEILQRPEHRW